MERFDLHYYTRKFIRHLERNFKSEETIKGYSADLKKFNAFIYDAYDGDVSLEQLTIEDLYDYFDFVKEKGFKMNTIARHLSTLKSFYRFLFDEMKFRDNIAARIKHPVVFTPVPELLTSLELLQLLNEAKKQGLYYFTVFAVLIYTGSRVTAVSRLSKKDVDLEKKQMYFAKIKGGRDLKIPIHEDLVPILEVYLQSHPAPESEYLFHSPKSMDMAIGVQNIRLRLKKAAKKADIKKRVTPHVLRHGFATQLTIANVPQVHVAELLGHTDLRSTKRYQHLHVEDLREPINTFKLG
ncbi:tyrosine-type recombinase/integrase [Bacillus sp. E(2018)]|uniref:tyrosine-type recombinase/integrase n=1 Tax=Bacillus sp. E(2018) TaxID=2502239 RepID=UPI0014854A4F|nr:tyrosine-type recombinase/integrase [Bacillus sp. E(2018)]